MSISTHATVFTSDAEEDFTAHLMEGRTFATACEATGMTSAEGVTLLRSPGLQQAAMRLNTFILSAMAEEQQPAPMATPAPAIALRPAAAPAFEGNVIAFPKR